LTGFLVVETAFVAVLVDFVVAVVVEGFAVTVVVDATVDACVVLAVEGTVVVGVAVEATAPPVGAAGGVSGIGATAVEGSASGRPGLEAMYSSKPSFLPTKRNS
jgi:hypothetical protein